MAERKHPFWAEVDGTAPLPPATQHLGLRFIAAEPGSGTIRVEFSPRQEFTNPRGQVQGGFLSAMLDDALSGALATTLEVDEFAVTIESKVNFIRPAGLGTILGEAEVEHRGRSIAFLRGVLRDLDGATLATATATAQVLRNREG